MSDATQTARWDQLKALYDELLNSSDLGTRRGALQLDVSDEVKIAYSAGVIVGIRHAALSAMKSLMADATGKGILHYWRQTQRLPEQMWSLLTQHGLHGDAPSQ